MQTARLQPSPTPANRSGRVVARAPAPVQPRDSRSPGQAAHGLTARAPSSDALGGLLQRCVAARAGRRMVARVSMKDCCNDWKNCLRSDTGRGAGVATDWKLAIAVDRESTKNLYQRIKAGNVGHTWLKLSDDTGTTYTYGMWPQKGFDADNPFKSVAGCVHHPDTVHAPPHATDYKEHVYTVTEDGFQKALDYAQDACKVDPAYNLMSYNCTTFAIEAAQAAGVTPPASSTLGVHNPNALYEGIEAEEASAVAALANQRRDRAAAMAQPNP